ncbi:CaiB/BaiF CoA-transferase family protein [Orbus sturtevantii]|uniref:CaiB/BaiF CoA transferase family protein n=1 Tax=Orbus sturtevantii TaxID=3074109 RepID=UPI00370DADC0
MNMKTEQKKMKGPMEGVRILDFTHVISGPFSTMLLADMGAEVIKIEKPGEGEFYRAEGTKNEAGVSIVYPNYNRNKKGITLNIKSSKAVELLKKMVAKADVFVENQRPGLLASIGLGYEDLKAINPKIIYASISGFGQDGPYARKPAFDMTIAAISGLMSVNGIEGTVPTKTGAAFSDFISGIYAALGIVAALRKRDKTGEGSYVDVGMFDSILSVLDDFIPKYKVTGKEPTRFGNRRAGFAPVNVFPVKNGEYVYIAGSFQKQWEALASLIGREELITDPRFKDNTGRKQHEALLESIVEEWSLTKTSQDAVIELEKAGIPCAPVKGIGDLFKDEHIQARNSIIECDYPGIGKYAMAANPIRISNYQQPVERAPMLGEHNESILNELLGYTADDIVLLKREGVI